MCGSRHGQGWALGGDNGRSLGFFFLTTVMSITGADGDGGPFAFACEGIKVWMDGEFCTKAGWMKDWEYCVKGKRIEWKLDRNVV